MTAQGNQLATWRARLFTAAWVLYAGFYICRKNMEGVVSIGPAHLAAEWVWLF
jgi:sugar phosphate permease